MKYDKEKINNLPKIEKIAFIWMLLSAISVFVTGVLRNYFYMFIIMGQALFIISILATIKYKNSGNSVPKIDFKKYIFVGLLGIFIICISIFIKINNINLIKYMPYVFYIILCLLFIFAGCIFAKKLYCNHFYLIKRCKVPVEISFSIGDSMVDGKPYSEIVEYARNYINEIGGFEKLAEWGLY